MKVSCDVCHTRIESEPFYHRPLENFDNSVDICPACILKSIGVFHQVLDSPYGEEKKCDCCGEQIFCPQLRGNTQWRYSIVNSTLIFCSSCLDLDSSLEQVNERVNFIIKKDKGKYMVSEQGRDGYARTLNSVEPRD